MLRNTLGIVNIEGTNVQFGDIMDHRGVQAFGFLGRYRMIDFVFVKYVEFWNYRIPSLHAT